MKRISLTLLAVLLVITAAFKASAQTTQNRQVSGFNAIAASASFSIHVKIDGTESVKVVADDKDINEIETVVKDGTLHIGTKPSTSWFRNMKHVDVYVTAKALSGLSNSGSGSINVEGDLKGNAVEIQESGSGRITCSAKSEKTHVHISGSGSIDLNGSSNSAELELSGSGGLKGKAFKVNDLKVRLSGSGSASVYADKSISAHISGSGSLVYAGNASVTDIKTSGSGRVKKGSDI